MTPRDPFPGAGIHGFADYRFYVAAILCLFSLTLFYESGGGPGAASFVAPFLIAFLFVSAAAWQHQALGSAESPAILVLHTLLAIALAAAFRAAGCSGFGITLLALAACLGGRKTAASCLAAGTLLALWLYLDRAEYFPGVLYFSGGWLALAGAGVLTRDDAAYADFWRTTLGRMQSGDRAPRIHNRLKVEILEELRKSGQMDMPALRNRAAHRLRCGPDDENLPAAVEAILNDLVEKDRLVAVRRDAFGERIVPEAGAYAGGMIPENWKRAARTVVVLTLAAGYLLSPADFLPDATPVSGLLDDAVVLAAGGLAAWRIWRT